MDHPQLDAPTDEPDWKQPLSLNVTPRGLIEALFWNAHHVHTGRDSCVDPGLMLSEVMASDEFGGNYCRLVEQEFADENNEDLIWHDWTVDLRIGEIHILGHWQVPANVSGSEWDWAARESEHAFEKACVLVGKRVKRTLQVEGPQLDSPADGAPAGTRHH